MVERDLSCQWVWRPKPCSYEQESQTGESRDCSVDVLVEPAGISSRSAQDLRTPMIQSEGQCQCESS